MQGRAAGPRSEDGCAGPGRAATGRATPGRPSSCRTRPRSSRAHQPSKALAQPVLRRAQRPSRRVSPAHLSAAPRSSGRLLRTQPIGAARPGCRSPTRYCVVSRPPSLQIGARRTAAADIRPNRGSLSRPRVALPHGDRQTPSQRLRGRHRPMSRPGRRLGHEHHGSRLPGWRRLPPAARQIYRRPQRPGARPSGPRRQPARLPAAAGQPQADRWPQTRRPVAGPVRRRRDSRALRTSKVLRASQEARGFAPPKAPARRHPLPPAPGGRQRGNVGQLAAAVRPSGR